MRCLVLGGRGFLGSHLVDALSAEGHEVRSFDRPGAIAPWDKLHVQTPKGRIFQIEGDFQSAKDLESALVGVDVCYHLISTTIASTSNADPGFDVSSNLLGTICLLECAVSAGVKRIVFASSGGTVYGVPRAIPINERHPTDPISSYGITKLAIEKYLHLYKVLYGLEYAVLRLANPYGEGQRLRAQQGAIAVFLGHVLRGENVPIWGDGSIVRDYLHVTDVTNAMIAASNVSDGESHVVNIGSGCGHSVNDILDAIERVTGCRAIRDYSPGRAFDVPSNILDITMAEVYLGWRPKISLDDGLRRFVNWVKKNENI